MAEQKQKILKGKVVGAYNGAWYKDDIGKTVEVYPFTHNYYLKVGDNTKTYKITDIKVIHSRMVEN